MRKQLIFLALPLAVMLIALGIAGNFSPVTAQSSGGSVGNLRIVNGLVGYGSVDVFIDAERVAFGLQPKETTPYFFLPAGKHQITVRPVNSDALTIPIADSLVDLVANGSITAIAYQKIFATSGDNPDPQKFDQSGDLFLMNDDRAPIQLGRTRLAVAHLAVGTPQHISIGYRSGEALLYQVGLEQPYGTIDIDANTQNLAVIDADSPNLSLLSNFGEWSFYANTLYTLIVVPNVTPPNNSNFVGLISSEPQMFIISAPIDPPENNGVRLRIIHAAHDTAVLDIYVDERLVARRVNYGRYTEYLGLANYGHTITLRRFGDPVTAPALGRAIFTINQDNKDQTNWTLLLVNANNGNSLALAADTGGPTTNAPVVMNTPGGDVLVALLPDNISATQRNNARVRVINAADGVQSLGLFTPAYPAPDLPPDVKPTATPLPGTLAQPVTLTDPVSFGAEANDSEVPVGLYKELNFVPQGSISRILQLTNTQLVSGLVYTFIVMGSPAGNPPIQVVTLEDYGRGVPVERQYLGTIGSNNVNMRSGPSTTTDVITTLNNNNQVSVLGRNEASSWIRIRFSNPQTNVTYDGWVSATVRITITRLGAPVPIAALPVYTGT